MSVLARHRWLLAIAMVALMVLSILGPAPGPPRQGGPHHTPPPADGPVTASDGGGGEEGLQGYTIVEGPLQDILFGYNLANVGDVNGDGVEDLLIGANETGYDPPSRIPGNYLLLGSRARDMTTDDLRFIQNMSSYWYTPWQRWMGDTDGDGLDDVVSHPAYNTFGDPSWLFGRYLQVRPGTPAGMANVTSPRYLDTLPPGFQITRGRNHHAGVGDVNGDGYNDLCVVYDTYQVPGQSDRHPGAILVYNGSVDGLPDQSSQSLEIGAYDWDMWQRLTGIYHGDVNGDGYSDVLVQAFQMLNRSLVRIHYGSVEGIKRDPDRSIATFPLHYSTASRHDTIRLHSPLNINGDENDDFLLEGWGSTEDPTEPRWVRIYHGANWSAVTPVGPRQTLRLDPDAAGMIETGDVNGDGLTDLVTVGVAMTEDSEGHPHCANVTLGVHFNSRGTIGQDPSLTRTHVDLPCTGWHLKIDTGDFDGDGFADVAMASWDPGENGSVILFWGKDIMEDFTCVDFDGGPTVYAGHKAYDFVVDANPTSIANLPSNVSLVLDPEGANVTLNYSMLSSSAPFAEAHDPLEVVDLRSTNLDVEHDDANNTVYVTFRVWFNWTWPHEDPCMVVAELHYPTGQTSVLPAGYLFAVENDLELVAPLSATWGDGVPLPPGGWARNNTSVELTGRGVVYQGTTDVHPPGAACNVTAGDDDGDLWENTVSEGGQWSVGITTDNVTDTEENVTLRLTDLPPTSNTTTSLHLAFGVDGDVPIFTNAVPEAEDWHSLSEVLVSITADDGDTAGIDVSTFEYSYHTGGDGALQDWTRMDLVTTEDGPEADAMVEIELRDGDDNFVQWRVRDLVGHLATSSPYRVKVDTRNVTYGDFFPTPGVWQTTLDVECGVTIHDVEGSGIEVASVQYRVSPRNLSNYGGWKDWDEGGTPDAGTVQVAATVHLAESPFNRVQWRAKDIAGNGYTTSPHYRIPVDVTPVAFDEFEPPRDPVQNTSSVMCWVTVWDKAPGSGVDLTRVEYRYAFATDSFTEWEPVVMEGTSMSNRFSVEVSFPDGLGHQVQFRGWDVAGNGPSASAQYVVDVDATPPEARLQEPADGERLTQLDIRVRAVFNDALTGLDNTTFEYRYGNFGPGQMGAWRPLEVVSGAGNNYSAISWVELSPGPVNWVQFRARDLAGNTGLSQAYRLWVNRPPVARISTPADDAVLLSGDEVSFSAAASEDPDDDVLVNVRWRIDGANVTLRGMEVTTVLEPGNYTVFLTVEDGYGGADEAHITISVEHVEPVSPGENEFPWWLLLVLVVVALAVSVPLVLWRQRSRRP